jgi:flagella basal body P-ring formation protein FlgA
MRAISILTGAVLAFPVFADTVVPARTIRPNQIIMETDVIFSVGDLSTGYRRISDVVGQEARIALYAGRPILLGDIGPPAIITRNQIVGLRYFAGGISITTDGRALERGAIGDRIRVMNLGSRATIFGQILDDGTIQVRN